MMTLVTCILALAILAGSVAFITGLVLQRKATDAKARSYARKQLVRGGYLAFMASVALLFSAVGLGNGIQLLVALALLLALWELTVVNTRA